MLWFCQQARKIIKEEFIAQNNMAISTSLIRALMYRKTVIVKQSIIGNKLADCCFSCQITSGSSGVFNNFKYITKKKPIGPVLAVIFRFSERLACQCRHCS